MKLGVICDGISRNLKHALNVMDEFNLEYAELMIKQIEHRVRWRDSIQFMAKNNVKKSNSIITNSKSK